MYRDMERDKDKDGNRNMLTDRDSDMYRDMERDKDKDGNRNM